MILSHHRLFFPPCHFQYHRWTLRTVRRSGLEDLLCSPALCTVRWHVLHPAGPLLDLSIRAEIGFAIWRAD